MSQLPKHAKKPRHTRRKLVLSLILVVLLAFGGGLLRLRWMEPLPAAKSRVLATSITGKPAISLAWPSFGEAAIGAAGYNILDVNGVQKPVPTASVAKLITALVVLKAKPLTAGQPAPTLTLTQQDADLYNSYVAQGGSVAGVAVGEEISEYQVLQAMLLPSANNLADSLASWAYGSLPAYATAANQWLTANGLNHTHVGSDASGFSATTTSTASDLVKLGELAVANPVLTEITAQPTADLPIAGTVNNVNWLLGTAGINGLKTGNSDEAGGVFLFSAAYPIPGGPTVTIVGAILGAPNLQKALTSAPPLITSVQKAFGYTTAITAGQPVGLFTTQWGPPVIATSSKAIKALTWQGRILLQPTVLLTAVTPPAAQGTVVGLINPNSKTNYSSITLSHPIPSPSWWWRLTHN